MASPSKHGSTLVSDPNAIGDAHEIAGKLVALAIQNKYCLEDIPLKVMQEYAPCIDENIFTALDLKNIVAARKHIGATAPEEVTRAAKIATGKLKLR